MLVVVVVLAHGAPAFAAEPTAVPPTVVSAEAKVKVKKDVITADGVEVGRFRDDPAMRGCFTLVGADGQDLLYFKWIQEPFQYVEAYRADDLDTLLFDAEADVVFKALIAKRLVRAGVLRDGAPDPEALDTFARKAGTEQTRLRGG